MAGDKKGAVAVWKTKLVTGARKLGKALTWVLPILVLGAVIYYFVRPTTPGAGTEAQPTDVYDIYTDFVRDYRPPSTRTPSQTTVNEWLGFFNSDSREWFRENADRMAVVRLRGRDIEWETTTRDRRQMEAMQFVIGNGPLGGGVARGQRLGDEGDTAIVDVTFSGRQWAVPMRRSRNRWVFANMMGQIPAMENRLQGVRIPGAEAASQENTQ